MDYSVTLKRHRGDLRQETLRRSIGDSILRLLGLSYSGYHGERNIGQLMENGKVNQRHVFNVLVLKT